MTYDPMNLNVGGCRQGRADPRARRGCVVRGMRRRGAGRERAPVEEDSSTAPDDAGDAPWARHVGPYPVSSFALDHATPERGKDAALRACEAEFRAFDGNLQAPTIRRLLWAGFVSAAARLANPLLRYQTKFAALSPTCRLTHLLENAALAFICVYCLARGFSVNRKTGMVIPPPSYWWHGVYVVLYCGAFARHTNDCVLMRAVGPGGMVGEQFTAFFVVALLVVGWRPPLPEVITSRVLGWSIYSTVISHYTQVHWYSHMVRLACGVLMPIALAAALDVRARRLFANEVAMHVGAGVWGVVKKSASRESGSARHSPAISPWQSPTPSPQYEFR